ncbi:putative glucose-methanol-choline (gmc) oxidoreductase [Tripterygium wilfordii]|uniref:Putative glucose-methanol-choline (Gmc) oxidoreductase n=1 Tax=Tripterygium wilfordii TaxID=458696 RepID=A0A7J7CAK0_TRIWF|nr:putative glucose-methanol-choline (gmc) oxidoreductase [Tripterygium wilfordii]
MLREGFVIFAAPAYTFVKEASSAPPEVHYDYIIVGGGTAGCPLAATLSQNARVLVLERGGSPYGNPDIENMGNFAKSLSDISPKSPSQPFISEDGVYNTRARVLGGGSALNAGFYTHASMGYVREFGWDEALVNKSYEWVERKIVFKPRMLQWTSALKAGLIEVGVLPDNGVTLDHTYGSKFGGVIFDKDGHRHTAADLLEYADPTKITVYLHSTVHKILFSTKGKTRAIGVIFEDDLGNKHTAYLDKNPKSEIILSAGALGSPQLLMLSGVGPAEHLKYHGIKVVKDQPMVGQGMADNPMNCLFVPSPVPVEVALVQVVGITRFDSYIESVSGINFATSWIQKLLSSYDQLLDQNRRQGDIVQDVISRFIQRTNAFLNSTITGGAIAEKIMGPVSRGHLELKTTNPHDNPSVTFNYFKEPEDLKRCVQGMKTIIKVLNSKAFSKFRYRLLPVQALINLMVGLPLNLRPRHVMAAFSLEQFCKDTVMTIWHYHGGCQVGKVVDQDYRVLGVDALRVLDGSTFIRSPGANPQATLMMLGR